MSLTEPTASARETMPAEPEPSPDLSLREILAAGEALKAQLRDPDCDPDATEALIDENIEREMAKVDRTVAYIRMLDEFATAAEARAAKEARDAEVARNKIARRMSYVQYHMGEHNRDEIAGHEFVFRRVRTKSKGKVIVRREADASAMLEFGEEFIAHTPESYRWEKKALAAAIKKGDARFTFCEMNVDITESVEFDMVGKPVERKKGKK